MFNFFGDRGPLVHQCKLSCCCPLIIKFSLIGWPVSLSFADPVSSALVSFLCSCASFSLLLNVLAVFFSFFTCFGGFSLLVYTKERPVLLDFPRSPVILDLCQKALLQSGLKGPVEVSSASERFIRHCMHLCPGCIAHAVYLNTTSRSRLF